jgi:hypothetical protein
VELVLIDDRADGRQFGDLVTQRLRIIALKLMTALPAVRRLTRDHMTELVRRNQGTNTTKVTRLPAPFLAGGRRWRAALDRRRVRRGRLGGVGRVLVEAFLQGSDPQLQGAHQGEHSRLRGWRNRVPEILWQWWSIRHATVLLNSHSEDKIGS